MKKIVLVIAMALATAAPASAKEILGLQLCGASGCATEKGGPALTARIEGPGGPFTDGTSSIAPAKAAPYYRLYALAGDRGKVFGRLGFYYVPAAQAIVVPGRSGATTTWQHANAGWRALIARLTTKVEPFAAPTISRVSLNGENASDPQSYLRLYELGGKATTYASGSEGSIQIVLESERRTPWTDGNFVVLYPKDGLLVRDGQLVSLPRDVVAAAAAGQSLAPASSFPWVAVLIAAAVAALVPAGMLLARRLPVRRPVAQA